jgi:hypothetical protein
MVNATLISKELHMGHDHTNRWGLLAIFGSAIFAAAAYVIFSAGEGTSIPFAIGEYGLLGSVAVMIVDSVAKCRAAH